MSILHNAYSMNNLRDAWDRVKRKNAAPGADGITVQAFGRQLNRNLSRLRRQILSDFYHPLPVLRCHIPKGDGDFRRIGIPAVADKVAQRALLDVLMPSVDAKLSPCSFAYRPRRSVAGAVTEIGRLRRLGNHWAARVDIDLCFESIPHEPLMERLWSIIPDGGVAEVVQRWLKAGVVDGPVFTPAEVGVQQGDVLSPVLANIYLDALDRDLTRLKYGFVRYADDMLIVCRDRKHAEKAQRDTASCLKRLQLKPDKEKTGVSSFVGGFRFLGTIFVGSMALPAIRVERPDGSVRFTSGYESSTHLEVKQRPQGGVSVAVTGQPVSDRQLARMLAREVVRERQGKGTEVGRALLQAWRHLKQQRPREEPEWEEHGSWAVVDD